MSLVEISATNYIVMAVGECKKVEWAYQQESDIKDEFVSLYKVRGMPIMSKETDTILSVEELVELAQAGQEVEVMVDSPVEPSQIIMVQEILSHKNLHVGTYRDATPEVNEEGEAKYTGIMMGYDKNGRAQIYTLKGRAGSSEVWHVEGGVALKDTELPLGEEVGDVEEGRTQVKLGGAIRFIANENDFIGEGAIDGHRHLAKIDVINKYV